MWLLWDGRSGGREKETQFRASFFFFKASYSLSAPSMDMVSITERKLVRCHDVVEEWWLEQNLTRPDFYVQFLKTVSHFKCH